MAAPLTEAAIQRMRGLIVAGERFRASFILPKPKLTYLLRTSRNTVREAVRALVTARVLDVRRGDGTYVTSLRPELLLAGIGAAADLLEDGFTLDLPAQVRRILEPAATAMAARRITDATLGELHGCLHRMSEATSHDNLVEIDEEFHELPGRDHGWKCRRWRRCLPASPAARPAGAAWRGVVEAGATACTIVEHAAILEAHSVAAIPYLQRPPYSSTSPPPSHGLRWVLEVEDGEAAVTQLWGEQRPVVGEVA